MQNPLRCLSRTLTACVALIAFSFALRAADLAAPAPLPGRLSTSSAKALAKKASALTPEEQANLYAGKSRDPATEAAREKEITVAESSYRDRLGDLEGIESRIKRVKRDVFDGELSVAEGNEKLKNLNVELEQIKTRLEEQGNKLLAMKQQLREMKNRGKPPSGRIEIDSVPSPK